MGHPNKCLICYSPVVSNSMMTKPIFLGCSGELAQQIVVIFTLRKVLNIPKAVCEKLIEEIGHPSSWGIFYCAKCSNIVEEAQFIAERLKDLHDKLNTLSSQIQTTLYSNFKKCGKLRMKSTKRDAVDEIRCQFAAFKDASIEQTVIKHDGAHPDSKEKLLTNSLKIEKTFSLLPEEISGDENYDGVNISFEGITNFAESENDEEYLDMEGDPVQKENNYDSPPPSPEYQGSENESCISDPEYILPSSRSRRKNRSSQKRKRANDESETHTNYTVKTEVPDTPVFTDDYIEKRVKELLEENTKTRLAEDSEGTAIHKCSRCNFKFKSELTRDAHEKRQHDGIKAPFICELCGNGYHRLCILLDHLKDHLKKSVFLCPKCPWKFKSAINRNAHLQRAHYGEKLPYACMKCNMKFQRPILLEKHLKKIHKIVLSQQISAAARIESHRKRVENGFTKPVKARGEKKFTCTQANCNFTFRCTTTRDAHVQRFHFGDKNPYKCLLCPKQFQRNCLLMEHNKEHDEETGGNNDNETTDKGIKRFRCTDVNCRFSFRCAVTRDAHVKRIHFGDKNPYKCLLCPKKFPRNCLLVEHNKEHDDSCNKPAPVPKPTSFPCQQCDKAFSKSSMLAKHVEVKHTGLPKMFMCELCSKTFRLKDYLKNHQMFEHHEELNLTPFKCKDCGKILGTERTLEHHTNMVHKKQFVFQCPHCPVGFRYQSNREKHMLLHSGERPFKCDQCPKDFSTNNALNNHLRVHTGEKPYKCWTCDKTFSDKPTFNRHTESHKGIAYPCNMCSKKFPTRHSLRVHAKKHQSKDSQMESRIRKVVVNSVDPLNIDSHSSDSAGILLLDIQQEIQVNLNGMINESNDVQPLVPSDIDIVSSDYADMPILFPSVSEEKEKSDS